MRTALVLALMAWLVVGCASIAESKKMQALDTQQKTFSKAIRWGAFDIAAAALKSRDPEAEPLKLELDRYQAIRVTASDELGARMNMDQTESVYKVVFHFYHAERGQVHKVLHTQLWWFDEEMQSWYLDGDLPDFFAAMQSGK